MFTDGDLVLDQIPPNPCGAPVNKPILNSLNIIAIISSLIYSEENTGIGTVLRIVLHV